MIAALSLVLAPPATAASATVALTTAAGNPGQAVTVALRLTSRPLRSVSVISFDVSFDASRLTYVGTGRGVTLATDELIFPEGAAGTVGLGVVDLAAETDPAFGLADGEFAQLTFQIKSTVTQAGTVALGISGLDAVDRTGAAITELTGTAGSLNITLPSPACTPNWTCGNWSACSLAGSQTRTCQDSNSCGVTTGKLPESQSCDTTPPSIANVQASNLGVNAATISWTTNEAATSQVEYGVTTAYGSASVLDAKLVTAHTVALANLSVGTTYHVRVKSRDAAGNQAVSADQTFATQAAPDTTPPAAITNLAAADRTETSVQLSWTAPGDDGSLGLATSYDLRYAVESLSMQTWDQAVPATGEGTPRAAGTGETFQLVGLHVSTTYAVALRSRDEVGNLSPLSNVVTFTTLAPPGPLPAAESRVTLTTPTPGVCLEPGQAVAVAWTRQNVDHVALYLTTDGGTTVPTFGPWFWMQAPGDAATTTIWTVPTTTSDLVRLWVEGHNATHTQRLALDAVDQNLSIKVSCAAPPPPAPVSQPPTPAPAALSGGGSRSGGSGYAPSDVTPPQAVENFVAWGTDGQVVLTWKNPESDDWVRTIILRKVGSPPHSPADGMVVYEGRGQEFTDTTLANGTVYTYAAYTFDRVPNYSQATTVSATPAAGAIAMPIPPAPALVAPAGVPLGRLVKHEQQLFLLLPTNERRPIPTLDMAREFGLAPEKAEAIGVEEFARYRAAHAITSGDRAVLALIDTDHDGLSNAAEIVAGTDANVADTDGDGVADPVELRTGRDPLYPDRAVVAPRGLLARVAGSILLDVNNKGRAYYVHPLSGRRYYLRDGAVAYHLMRRLGLGITNAQLAKLPLAFPAAAGLSDGDGDGLPDAIEVSLGTDPARPDTDGDGYADGVEVRHGFSPLGRGRWLVDRRLQAKLKGLILLQVQAHGEAWYLNPRDGKRYFLANGQVALELMRGLSLGVTTETIVGIPYQAMPP